MRIVVIGAGAMGSLFGRRLAEAGYVVTLVDADPDRVAAINARGITENGQMTSCTAALPGTPGPAADLVIVFTKATATAAAIAQNAGLVGAETSVLTLQNGLGNAERIAATVSAGQVLTGVTDWPADLLDHGVIHVGGAGTVKLWSLDGADRPAIHAVVAALNAARLAASATPDVVRHIWQKVIFNAALNGVAALTGLTVGRIGDVMSVRQITMRLVEEGIAIAQANGIPVVADEVRASVDFALAHHRSHKPSMLQDIEGGRATESDSIQGGLLRAAMARGVPAPVLETCLALLHGLDVRNADRGGNSEVRPHTS